MFFHGYRRFTEDIDLLVSRAGFDRLKEHLDDLGLVLVPHGGRHPRDVETGVRVELLVTGEFPGDRKPLPFVFPDPTPVAIKLAGLPCLRLPVLIELKVAAGLSSPGRLKDIADVQELIRVLGLPYAAKSMATCGKASSAAPPWNDALPLAITSVRFWPATAGG